MPPISTEYIKKARQRGESDDEIKRSLRIQGISEQDINTAFASVGQSGAQPEATPPSGLPTSHGDLPTNESVPRKEYGPTPQAQPSSFASSFSPQSSTPEESSKPTETGPQWGGVQQPAEGSGRMQYEKGAKSKSSLWVTLAIVLLIILGLGAASYYYKVEIMKVYDKYFGVDGEPASTTTDTDITPPATTPPATTTDAGTDTTPPVGPELTVDEKKLKELSAKQIEVDSYYATNSIYPQTVDLTEDGNFYCYRKAGTHYILGTTLETNDEALATDLDGTYLCGETTKYCADPVYCVGPK
ncbi:MAG: hypothetical protein ABII97_02995 [Patescibacteria group bacterium]